MAEDIITPEQRQTARNLGYIVGHNAQSTRDQFARANEVYDISDIQNRKLADEQLFQHTRQSADDRFSQMRKLQRSAAQLLDNGGAMLDSSGRGGLRHLFRSQADLDRTEANTTLRANKDSVYNQLQEAFNANQNARNSARNDAIFALRGIEADAAAQLNNINPNLFVIPTRGATDAGSNQLTNGTFAGIAPDPRSSDYGAPAPRVRRPPGSMIARPGSGYILGPGIGNTAPVTIAPPSQTPKIPMKSREGAY